MRKLLRTFPVSITLLVVLAIASGVALAAHAGHAVPATSCRPLNAVDAVGAPAIAVTQPCQVPAFTESDVGDYIAANGFPGGKAFAADGVTPVIPAISRVSFVPREQAEALLQGESLGSIPPGTLVCYVEFAGPIHVNPNTIMYPPDLSGSPGQIVMASGHEVFDARTGNLLNWGLLPPS